MCIRDRARLVAQLATNIISDANPDSLTANGLDRRKGNDILVGAFVEKARETGDPSILDALRYVETPGGSVMDIPRYRNQILDVTTELQAREERAARFDDWKRTKNREEVHRSASNRAFLAFERGDTDEYEAALEEFRANGLAEDAFHLDRLVERTTQEDAKVVEDPADIARLYAEMQDNPEIPTQDLLARYEGKINASTARAAFAYHRQQFDRRDITQSPRVRQSLALIEDVVKGNELSFASEAAVNYANARSFFYDELDDWMEANPDARSIPRSVLEEIQQKIFTAPGLSLDPAPNVFPGVQPGGPTDAQTPQAVQAAPELQTCLLYTSPSPRDRTRSRMPSSA